MRLTWWGHSTVLVDVDGVRVMADPVLRNHVGPLRRAVPLPAAARPERHGGLDAVLISHLHHDHCDLASLRRLSAGVVLAPPGAGGWLRRQGLTRVEELGPGEVAPLATGVTVTAVPARHHGRREPRGPFAAPVGHLVEGSATVWLVGDTGLFRAMAELPAVTRSGRIDVAAVPVWGWGPRLGPGHLDPEQAAEAVVRARVALAVPVHWGTLHPAGMRWVMRRQLATPGLRFARELEALGGARGVAVRAHVLGVGDSLGGDPGLPAVGDPAPAPQA